MWPFSKRRRLFEGVPGPSPWYFSEHVPLIPRMSWASTSGPHDGGLTLLQSGADVLLAVDFYNYVLPLDSTRSESTRDDDSARCRFSKGAYRHAERFQRG